MAGRVSEGREEKNAYCNNREHHCIDYKRQIRRKDIGEHIIERMYIRTPLWKGDAKETNSRKLRYQGTEGNDFVL